MPFINGFSRHKFSLLILILTVLATLLAACGEASPTTGVSTPPATSANIVSPNVGTTTVAATPPASRTSSIAQGTAPATTAASTISAATTAPAAPTAPAATQLCSKDITCQPTLTTAPAVITKANGEKINMTIELARTDQEQATGMMGRLSAPEDTGMLFIFPNTGRIAFWMENTPMALSIAFITQDGKIIDIQDMAAFSLDNHAPDQDYKTALEVPKGYFAKKGITAGDTFSYQS